MNISKLTRTVLLLNRQSGINFSPIHVSGVRCLYSPSALGVDGYIHSRERVKAQFNDMSDRFRVKMRDFVDPKSINMVFTEDLKHMLHLVEPTEDDLQLVEDMMVKFNKQNRDLRFGSFIFGPVVMRMYHHLNRPKEAFQAFLNPELEHFFDQIVSFQILMDLLFRNDMYDEVMQVADIVKDKQLPNNRYPRNVILLAMAAAYKKNTPDSMEYMKKLWSDLQDAGHEPMRRTVTFAAALAINQNAPHIAVEILSDTPKQTYVTVRNLKVSALVDLNRLDDAVPILRSVLEVDGPNEQKNTFCSEVVDKAKAAADKCDQKEVQQEFNRVLEQLVQYHHISDIPLDTVLCSEIEKVVINNAGRSDQRVLAAKFNQRGREQFQRPRRQGLQEME